MAEISKKQMEVIDKLYRTPGERASTVHVLLEDIRRHLKKIGAPDIPSDWDILCFCVEYIGLQSIAMQEDTLKRLAISVSQWLYSTHYSHPARIYGEPDRQQEESHGPVVHQEGKQVPRSNGSGDLRGRVEGYEGNEPPA